MKNRTINLALVCSVGGHFEQMTNLHEFYQRHPHFWITNANKQSLSQLQKEKKYFIRMAHYKKPWTYLFQAPQIVRIFAAERPTHILSTGSGRTAFIPFILSKIMGIKFIYIDTFSRVKGHSKMGTFLLKTGNQIFTQWENFADKRALYIGPIFCNGKEIPKKCVQDYIFVAVGTRIEPFTRLLRAVEDLKRQGYIKERVVVQAGYTRYQSDLLEIFDFVTPAEIDGLILNARYVITQESAGIGTKCLKFNTKFIVMPRDYRYNELPAKSDMKEDLHFKLEEIGYVKVVHTTDELRNAIENIDKLKSGFVFDNQLAIMTLNRVMEDQ